MYAQDQTLVKKDFEALEVEGNDAWSANREQEWAVQKQHLLDQIDKEGSLDVAYEYETLQIWMKEKSDYFSRDNYHKLSKLKMKKVFRTEEQQ